LYRLQQFAAVTGIPSSGKSNWLDNLLVNLAKLHGWNFALFSPENLPLEQHMAAIAEKYSGKPFTMVQLRASRITTCPASFLVVR